MKKHLHRILSVFLVFLLAFSMLLSFALAADDQPPVSSTGTIWSNWANSAPDWVGDVLGVLLGSVCPTSPDHLHHGKVINKNNNPLAPPGTWVAKCDYCSDSFTVHSDDMQNAYNEHVNKVQQDFGSTIFGSDGGFWLSAHLISNKTTGSPFSSVKNFQLLSPYSYSVELRTPSRSSSDSFYVYFDYDYVGALPSGTLYAIGQSVITNFSLVPASVNDGISLSSLVQAHESVYYFPTADSSSVSYAFSDGTFLSAGAVLYSSGGSSSNYRNTLSASLNYTGNLSFVMEVTYDLSRMAYFVPYVPVSIVSDSGSRVGSLSGNFGYYGDNGQFIAAENVKIVDETNSTIYNPVTGATTTITDWTYDYSDRSYNVTTESGDTVSVTYGDENITIKQGDTIYNVYYVISDGGSGGGDVEPTLPPSEHVHDYKSVVTTEPTCVAAGLKTFTCAGCGDSYIEKIPATGHIWTVEKTVNTTYDDDGNILTQGYTIYKCSVCGDEYKDEAGNGPPNGGGSSGSGILDKLGELLGSIFGGILEVLGGVVGKILDALISIVNMLTEKLDVIVDALFKVFDEVPKMFSGFTDFLSGIFAFIPPEIVTMLVFGILAIVLIAIFKAFVK